MTKKQPCIDCKKETTNGVFILTGKNWVYEYYCINCARAYLGKMSSQSMLKLNQTQLNQASREYDMMLQGSVNEMKKNNILMDDMPVEYKKFITKKSDGFA